MDGKGRVILPARLRVCFDGTGYLAPHEDGCIALWTRDDFAAESSRQHSRDREGRAARDELRDWYSRVSSVKVDSQGRMAVPSDLKAHAALQVDVLFVGVHDRVELWAKERWDRRSTLPGTQGIAGTEPDPGSGS